MSEVKIKINWPVIILYCLIPILALLPACLITWSAVTRYLAGQPLHYVDSWSTLVFVDALLLTGCSFFLGMIIALASTRFTDEGIWQRKIIRWTFIAWKDITSIETFLGGLRIVRKRKRIGIFTLIYSNWDEISDFINRRIPHLNRK